MSEKNVDLLDKVVHYYEFYDKRLLAAKSEVYDAVYLSYALKFAHEDILFNEEMLKRLKWAFYLKNKEKLDYSYDDLVENIMKDIQDRMQELLVHNSTHYISNLENIVKANVIVEYVKILYSVLLESRFSNISLDLNFI